ncbi:hypothetical protein [Nocardia carnea]|uniref:hypothetical protein n=1 Tax=Nocardia carnea TaxID=37328 RepID=UPI000AF8ED03|nr:hypothetical protein [Nocardia carnea]
MSNFHPAIIALYRATTDPAELAEADAFRSKLKNAALRGIVRERAELAACPAEATGWLAGHHAAIRSEIRRALDNGASTAEIRAALTAAPVKA